MNVVAFLLKGEKEVTDEQLLKAVDSRLVSVAAAENCLSQSCVRSRLFVAGTQTNALLARI